MKLNQHWVGVSQLLLASVGFGFLGIFGKIAFDQGLGVGSFLTYRFVLATLLLWAYCLLFNPSVIRFPLQQIFISALLGIFGYAVFSSLYFTAVHGVSVALASMLLYTYPFWVSVLSHFFLGERMSSRQWLCLSIATLGLAFLLWGHIEVHNTMAVLAGLGSAMTYAIYILASAHFQKKVKPLSSSLYVITFCALALYLYHHPSIKASLDLSVRAGTSVVGIAIICTIMPLTLILAGLQKMKSSEAALLTMMEPITAAAMAWFIFHESLEAVQILGVALVLGSIAARTLWARS